MLVFPCCIRITVSKRHLLPISITTCRVDDRRICFVSELCVLDCVVLLVGCSGNVSWSVGYSDCWKICKGPNAAAYPIRAMEQWSYNNLISDQQSTSGCTCIPHTSYLGMSWRLKMSHGVL